jgi:phosphonate transport system permease protein
MIRSSRNISLIFLLIALLCLPFADLEVYQVEPWEELARMGQGLILPSFPELSILANSLMITVAFALLAVAGAAVLGLCLALIFHWRVVRIFSASIRSVHELFWGLLFMACQRRLEYWRYWCLLVVFLPKYLPRLSSNKIRCPVQLYHRTVTV